MDYPGKTEHEKTVSEIHFVAVVLFIIAAILIFPILLFSPKQSPAPNRVVKLPPASKVGEKVGQTSGNFVQGFLKGHFPQYQDL